MMGLEINQLIMIEYQRYLLEHCSLIRVRVTLNILGDSNHSQGGGPGQQSTRDRQGNQSTSCWDRELAVSEAYFPQEKKGSPKPFSEHPEMKEEIWNKTGDSIPEYVDVKERWEPTRGEECQVKGETA